MLVCACVFFGARAFTAETDSISPPPSADTATQAMANGYLQIQEQLHATLLAIDNSRRQAEAEAATNSCRFDGAHPGPRTDHRRPARQRNRGGAQNAAARAVHGGAFGLIGLGIMLLMVYFQWRVFTQLIKISTWQPSALALGNNRPLPLVEAANELAAPGRAVVESSNARLLDAVERLEKRILELEQIARAPLAETTAPSAANKNGSPPDADDREECVANLITEGQSLLNADEPQKALECFDVALQLQPKHAEALVKKAGAWKSWDGWMTPLPVMTTPLRQTVR